MYRWTPTSWHTRGGRLTLAGPAAHTLPIHSGLAVSNAIADAFAFVGAIQHIAIGNQVRAHAIPALGYRIVARAVEDREMWRDPVSVGVDRVMLNDAVAYADDITQVLKASKGPKTCLKTSVSTSDSSAKQPRSKRAGSLLRTWLSKKIENLDVGAQEGTAQTGWIALGHRQYGRRHFPD